MPSRTSLFLKRGAKGLGAVVHVGAVARAVVEGIGLQLLPEAGVFGYLVVVDAGRSLENDSSLMNSSRAFWLVMAVLMLVHMAAGQMLVNITSPTNGAHLGKAAGMELNLPLQAQLINPGPGFNTIYYYANGALVATSRSAGSSHSTMWSNVAFGSYTLLAGNVSGAPDSPPVTIHVDTNGVALISEQSIWAYLDGGENPPTNWFQPDADVSPWKQGLPQFGFGESDEQTIVNFLTPSNSIYPAYYFHQAFLVTNAAAHSNLQVKLLRDDGAIVYLNGQELFRDNMPAGPVDYLTYASAGANPENVFEGHWINPALLLEGTNHLAVEIHNQGPHSDDISFDLRLLANLAVPPPRLTLTQSGTNLTVAWARAYPGYRFEAATQIDGPWVTLTNVSEGVTEFRSTNVISGDARFFRLAL